jgi:hypothetical protein
MEAQLQQFPVQEVIIPLLSEPELLALSKCSTTLGRICAEWFQHITLPPDDRSDTISADTLLANYCRDNKVISLKLLMDKYGNDLWWDYGLVSACEGGGNYSIAETMIEKGQGIMVGV